MTLSENIYFALSLFLIIPIFTICIVPFFKYLKYPAWVCFLISLGVYLVTFFVTRPLIIYSNGHYLLVMLPIFLVMFLVYNFICTLDLTRCLLIFLWACAHISFASAFSRGAELTASTLGADLSSYTNVSLIRVFLSLLLVLTTLIMTSKWDFSFLTSPHVPSALYWTFIPVPVIIFYINTVLIPYDASYIQTASELTAYLMMMIGTFILGLFLTQVFYSVASLYAKNARIQEEKRLLEIQTAQYNSLTKEVSRTSRLIHDFKHTVNTLKTMAAEEHCEKIEEYLETLGSYSVDTTIMNYCENPAINSVLNHFALRSRQEEVPLTLQVDLPAELPMKDFELCSLIGNLMENAIDACRTLPPHERNFSFSIVMKGNNLFIVSSNSFDGIIKQSGDEFLSTKHSGFGIGIRSVAETVSLYGGTLKIHHEKNEFFTDIAINFPSRISDI